MAEFKIVDDAGELHMVGLLPTESLAMSFCDHLNSMGVPSLTKTSLSGRFEIYVRHEKDISRAKIELIKFAQSPFGKSYRKTSWEQGKKFRQQKQLLGSIDVLQRIKLKSVTTIIEIACLVVFIMMFFEKQAVISALGLFKHHSFADPLTYLHLITPIFMHYGIIHIAFNLVMFEAFARKIENVLGSVKLLVLILLLAAVSNYLQYLFMQPDRVFGGMSGVVYGIIAYSAMLASHPDIGYRLQFPKGLLVVSLIFVAFGFMLDGMANFCHLGGVILGILLGLYDRYRIKS